MISNPAKLLRAVMRLMGVTDTRQLAAELDIPLRTIQRLKLECATEDVDATSAISGAGQDAKGANCAISGAPIDANDAINGASGASRTHARIETPSGLHINLSEVPASQQRASEVEIQGLNGSTPRLVGQLAGWLAGPMTPPDREAARSILVGSVEAYGADKVRAGMLELETLIASGEKPRNLPKTFSAYVKAAKLPDPNAPAKQPNANRPAWAVEKDAKRAAFMEALKASA